MILVPLALIWLRIKKYIGKLDPNAETIVGLINKLGGGGMYEKIVKERQRGEERADQRNRNPFGLSSFGH